MPMVRGLRTLNAIETGSYTGSCLDTLLQDGGRYSDFSTILTMPGETAVLVNSNTAMNTITNSNTAMCLLFSFGYGISCAFNSTVAINNIFQNCCSLSFLSTGNCYATTAFNCAISCTCTLNSISNCTATLTQISTNPSIVCSLSSSKTFMNALYTNNPSFSYCCSWMKGWPYPSCIINIPTSGVPQCGMMFYSNGYLVNIPGACCLSAPLCVQISCNNGSSWCTICTGLTQCCTCTIYNGCSAYPFLNGNYNCGQPAPGPWSGYLLQQVNGYFTIPASYTDGSSSTTAYNYFACVASSGRVCLICCAGTSQPMNLNYVVYYGPSSVYCSGINNQVWTSIPNSNALIGCVHCTNTAPYTSVRYSISFSPSGGYITCSSCLSCVSLPSSCRCCCYGTGISCASAYYTSVAPIGPNNYNSTIYWPLGFGCWTTGSLCVATLSYNPATCTTYFCCFYSGCTYPIWSCTQQNYSFTGATYVSNTCYHIATTTCCGTVYTCNGGQTFAVFSSCPITSSANILTVMSNCKGCVVVWPTCGNCISVSSNCGSSWTTVCLPICSCCWGVTNCGSDRPININSTGPLFYAWDAYTCCNIYSTDGSTWFISGLVNKTAPFAQYLPAGCAPFQYWNFYCCCVCNSGYQMLPMPFTANNEFGFVEPSYTGTSAAPACIISNW